MRPDRKGKRGQHARTFVRSDFHRATGCVLQHEVQIAVRLVADERHRRSHPIDAPLEREAGVWEFRWTRLRDEPLDRRVLERDQLRPVLQRLDRPAFDAARRGSLAPARERRSREQGGQSEGYQ